MINCTYPIASILVLASGLSLLRAAETGVSPTEILLGQCADLTANPNDVGTGMYLGLQAAFSEANRKGGVYGRAVRLITENDNYEPDQTVDCTAKMVEKAGVFSLVGYVGTATSKVAATMAEELKIPIIGPLTGARLLRSPARKYVVNIRSSYDEESEALVGYLAGLGISKISIFYQNDSFGLSVRTGVEAALARRNLTVVSTGWFERNTVAVRSGLAQVIGGAPEAVIIVAPSSAAIAFLRAARQAGLNATFAASSFIGTESLVAQLGAEAEGVIISQVVPSPWDPNLGIAKDYRNALTNLDPAIPPNYAGFEGYIAGRVVLAGLNAAGIDLTREKLMDAFNALSPLAIGDMRFLFSELNHQGSSGVFLTAIKDGRAQPVH